MSIVLSFLKYITQTSVLPLNKRTIWGQNLWTTDDETATLDNADILTFQIFIFVASLFLFSSVGAAASSTTGDDCECGKGLLHPNLILGLIIWLLILTILVRIHSVSQSKFMLYISALEQGTLLNSFWETPHWKCFHPCRAIPVITCASERKGLSFLCMCPLRFLKKLTLMNYHWETSLGLPNLAVTKRLAEQAHPVPSLLQTK